jgi:acyl-CoA dehydrogenase
MMEFGSSAKVESLRARLDAFMQEFIYPNEPRFFVETERLGPWEVQPVIEELKPKARAAGPA